MKWIEDIYSLDGSSGDEKEMNDFIDQFKLFSDLDGNGMVDISDFKIGIKYFSMIYLGLMSIMYTLIGEDLTALKDNTYFMVVFGVLAGIFTLIGVIARKRVNGKEKEIKRLKELNTTQGALLYTQQMEMSEAMHMNTLELMEKDFQLRIKDKIVQEKI